MIGFNSSYTFTLKKNQVCLKVEILIIFQKVEKVTALNNQLALRTSSGRSLIIYILDLLLTEKNGILSELILSFQVRSNVYKHIDTKALFNLKSEIRSPIIGGKFNPSLNIQIKMTLAPELLVEFTERIKCTEQAVKYLQKLSCEEPNHSLLSAHSWYALEVKQQQETGEVGYRTLWYYLNLADITPNGIDPETMNQAMLNFAKEWEKQPSSDAIDENSVADKINELTQTFESLTQDLSTTTQDVISETVGELTQAFEELTDSFSEVVEELEETETDIAIYDALIDFFKTESWPFQTLPQQAALRLAFKGKNGQWDCYAKAREEQQQVVFYSICPINAPQSHRDKIAEFITRANYGLILGNFELDYSDGDIRYKTSIDVEGDRLSSALIRNLIYTNVLTMDQYLPGISALLEHEITPQAAISLVESAQPSP